MKFSFRRKKNVTDAGFYSLEYHLYINGKKAKSDLMFTSMIIFPSAQDGSLHEHERKEIINSKKQIVEDYCEFHGIK